MHHIFCSAKWSLCLIDSTVSTSVVYLTRKHTIPGLHFWNSRTLVMHQFQQWFAIVEMGELLSIISINITIWPVCTERFCVTRVAEDFEWSLIHLQMAMALDFTISCLHVTKKNSLQGEKPWTFIYTFPCSVSCFTNFFVEGLLLKETLGHWVQIFYNFPC